MGANPILFGHFTCSRTVVVRPFLSCIPSAALVRIAPSPAEEGGHAQQQFWAARLKDVLIGQAVFPGLRLTFESFGARVSFEVMSAWSRDTHSYWKISFVCMIFA